MGGHARNGRRRARPRWIVLTVVLIALVTATTVTTILVRSLSGDAHLRTAKAEARHLLSLARIPPRASEVSRAPVDVLRQPALQPRSDHLVDEIRWFTVAGGLHATDVWIKNHPPRGLSLGTTGSGGPPQQLTYVYTGDPDTDAYVSAELQISLTGDGPNRTAMRFDGMDVWLTSKPAQYQPRTPQVRVTTRTGCPSTLSGVADVKNARDGLVSRMLPSDSPIGGIVCRYGEGKVHLVRRVILSATSARELAVIIGRVRTGSAGTGITSCPMDQGQAEILAFEFKGRPDVDLWYHNAGCQYLDNGYIIAAPQGNASFYSAFVSLIERLSR